MHRFASTQKDHIISPKWMTTWTVQYNCNSRVNECLVNYLVSIMLLSANKYLIKYLQMTTLFLEDLETS